MSRKGTDGVRTKIIRIRMNEKEVEKLKGFQQQSIERSVSNYAREVLLQKPVIVKYRNQSADEILTELLKIKNELSAIGNNLNQAVHKLHTLDRIPEFRPWIMVYESTRQLVEKSVATTNLRMQQIYLKWSLE